ncbi:MAG: hypothetical protein IT245_01115, partial [Bacteroidia bacterium]|nr:hypothetical protein [Bacteroidia bacterium]
RLLGFYTVAGLKPELDIHILIPEFLRPLARITWGDRLTIADSKTPEMKYSYSTLGFKDLIPGILKGEKYIEPFQKNVIQDKKKKQLKDYINLFIFDTLDFFSLVNVPPAAISKTYHGYLEIVAIKSLRNISWETYSVQANKDFPEIFKRLNGNIPLSPELVIPDDVKDNIVVFPNGTSRQFVPVDWAKANLPNAYYALFHKDAEVKLFTDAGLKVIPYYKEPGDIIAIAKNAKWNVSTDSFPSHLLQTANERTTVCITEVNMSRVISPAFKGKVVDSEVPCHPCVHLTRNVPCAAGYMECLNWKNPAYTLNIVNSTLV